MSNGEALTDQETDMWTVVRRLIEVPEAEYEGFKNALEQPHLTRHALANSVSAVVPSVSRAEVADALGTMIGYLAGWMGAGRPGKVAIEERAARRVYPSPSDETSRARAAALFKQPALWLAAGALDASQSRGLNVARVAVGVDLTPILWTGDSGTALLPSFPLNVDTFNPFSADMEQRQSFVLDLTDLRNLRDEVSAAIDEVESLRSRYSEAGIVLWNAPEESDLDEQD